MKHCLPGFHSTNSDSISTTTKEEHIEFFDLIGLILHSSSDKKWAIISGVLIFVILTLVSLICYLVKKGE